jgi:hypothetical protein
MANIATSGLMILRNYPPLMVLVTLALSSCPFNFKYNVENGVGEAVALRAGDGNVAIRSASPTNALRVIRVLDNRQAGDEVAIAGQVRHLDAFDLAAVVPAPQSHGALGESPPGEGSGLAGTHRAPLFFQRVF